MSARCRRVLVVDDEAGLRALLLWVLTERGYAVAEAASGNEALALLGQRSFDVVVSDVRMKDGTGIDLLRSLQADETDVGVIITTAYASLDAAVDCLRAGALDLLHKPFEIDDLVRAIERATERRRLRATARLYDASQAILAAREAERLPDLVAETARAVMGADDATVLVPGPDGQLEYACSSGLPSDRQTVTRIRIAERVLVERVAELQAPALLPEDLATDPRFEGLSVPRGVASVIIQPLVHNEQVLGVLVLGRTTRSREFTRDDLELAGILAAQIALALDNARLLKAAVTSERLAAIGQTAAGVVHEINNPVSCILTNLEMVIPDVGELLELVERVRAGADLSEIRSIVRSLLARPTLMEVEEATRDAMTCAERVRDIGNDLRALARPDDNSMTPFDLSLAIRSAVRVVAAQLRERATVETDLTDGLIVLGSPGRLSQVFVNLLANAAQAITSPGRGLIKVRSRRQGARIVAEVEDTGAGMGPQQLARLFQPFFTTKPEGQGTGLGLFVSQAITQRHGGEILVRSEPGHGSVFSVSLPAVGVAQPMSTAVCPQPPRLRLLFIDDDIALLRTLQRAFSPTHDVVRAEGGRAGLRLLDGGASFDLIVCDLMMPDVHGIDVFRAVSERCPMQVNCFVFMTGGSPDRALQRELEQTHRPVLAKPFGFDALRPFLTPP